MVWRTFPSSSCRWWRVQRERKLYPATFRARRIREEMTISLIGPLPRSHSPAPVVRSDSFIRVSEYGGMGVSEWARFANPVTPIPPYSVTPLRSFRLPDLVPELGGPL